LFENPVFSAIEIGTALGNIVDMDKKPRRSHYPSQPDKIIVDLVTMDEQELAALRSRILQEKKAKADVRAQEEGEKADRPRKS
jgi:hypothetical protein